MTISMGTMAQIAILSTGIYIVLGFLRTARGGSLVRGLTITLLFGVAGLWWLSKFLQLEELEYIIQSITGFAFVIVAILFQPELRRGIVHLGENPLLGRLLQTRRHDVLSEVAQAVVTMAKKRQGALIAFERKIPLDHFIDSAVKVDADINRFLLDSIFHHGSALHDGAVILRGDRIEAATSLFPLTEAPEISKSTGTRHRAALGLTEETDAVTVAVSEETGTITICKHGKMEKGIPAGKLETVLRERLGKPAKDVEARTATTACLDFLRRVFLEDVPQKLGAVGLGIGLFWVAYQDVREVRTFQLSVATIAKGQSATPTPGQLLVVLPDSEHHLEAPDPGAEVEVTVTGTRAQLEPLSAGIGGVLVLGPDDDPGSRPFPLQDVRWGAGRFVEALEVEWSSSPPPELSIARFESRRFALTAANVPVDASSLDLRYEARSEALSLRPSTVQILGPLGKVERLATDELPLLLEPIVLEVADNDTRVEALQLSPSLLAAGFSLVGVDSIEVSLEIVPAVIPLGDIEREIAVVWLATERPSELERWTPRSQIATFTVKTAGILEEADPGSELRIQQNAIIHRYLEDNLRVFIDVSEVDHEGGSAVIRWIFETPWQDALPPSMRTQDPRASLTLELQGDRELLLIAR